MAKSRLVKGKAQVGQKSGRVIKGADRTNGATGKKSMSQYSSTTLGKNC